jgi:hypothetical protein
MILGILRQIAQQRLSYFAAGARDKNDSFMGRISLDHLDNSL